MLKINIYIIYKKTMTKYYNIKISNADLPKPFIVSNARMDEQRSWKEHGEANWYCAVNEKYSCYGKDYRKLCRDIDVHWWLTFAESLSGCKEEFSDIYNAYLKLEGTKPTDKVWIFGFDTRHHGDSKEERSTEAVEREARSLQRQLLSDYVPTQEDIDKAKAED